MNCLTIGNLEFENMMDALISLTWQGLFRFPYCSQLPSCYVIFNPTYGSLEAETVRKF